MSRRLGSNPRIIESLELGGLGLEVSFRVKGLGLEIRV